MENLELLSKIAKEKKKLIKLIDELESQSDIRFGYSAKLPEIFIFSGIGDISRITDKFMVATESKIGDYPLEFSLEYEGIRFYSITGEK